MPLVTNKKHAYESNPITLGHSGQVLVVRLYKNTTRSGKTRMSPYPTLARRAVRKDTNEVYTKHEPAGVQALVNAIHRRADNHERENDGAIVSPKERKRRYLEAMGMLWDAVEASHGDYAEAVAEAANAAAPVEVLTTPPPVQLPPEPTPAAAPTRATVATVPSWMDALNKQTKPKPPAKPEPKPEPVAPVNQWAAIVAGRTGRAWTGRRKAEIEGVDGVWWVRGFQHKCLEVGGAAGVLVTRTHTQATQKGSWVPAELVSPVD